MSITAVTSRGGANSITPGASIGFSPSANIVVGKTIIVQVGSDNLGTSSADTSQVTGISDDAGGNTYIPLGERTRSAGVVADGATVSTFLCNVTTQINTGHVITAALSAGVDARAISVYEITASGPLQLVASVPQSVSGTGVFTNSLSGLPNKEYLFWLAQAEERTAGAGSVTNYTAITGAVANTGTNATSIALRSYYRIITSTGDAPAMSGQGNSDKAFYFFALEELTNAAPDTPTVTVDDFDHNSVDLSSSAFSDSNGGDTHTASQWQVDEDGGDFSTPVADSGTDTTNLTTRTLTGLVPETAYIARVRHRDSSGDAGTQWSAWSAASSPFTTLGVPVATITTPASGTTIPSGGSIMLAGTGTDAEDGAITGADLAWESNIDGALGTGSPLHATALTDGDHNITLTATDSDGNEGTDTISITVGGGGSGGGGLAGMLSQSPFVRS